MKEIVMKLYSGACERNQPHIAAVLKNVFDAPGLILEIASGTGMHAAYFANRLPHLQWQPSDVQDQALDSICAWHAESDRKNFLAPVRIDAAADDWELSDVPHPIQGIFNANMIHIAPWEATCGLLRGAGRHLVAGAALVTYGPYRFQGRMSESNEQFHASLQSQNAQWGVRDVESIIEQAKPEGLSLSECHAMPANNHLLVFRKQPMLTV